MLLFPKGLIMDNSSLNLSNLLETQSIYNIVFLPETCPLQKGRFTSAGFMQLGCKTELIKWKALESREEVIYEFKM